MTEFRAEEIAAVFGRGAADYDEVIPFFTSFGRRLVEEAGLKGGERVLDVGCGRGATLVPASEAVGPDGTVLGVDLSVEMVSLSRAELERRGITNASVRRMDAGALELEPESYDVVLASFLLHLVPDPPATAAEIYGVLRPGGRCGASVPVRGGQLGAVLLPVLARFAPRATRPPPMPFRPDFDLVATLASAGFVETRSVSEEIEFLFPDERSWWRWAWSHGMRAFFELLSPPDLAEIQQVFFAELARVRRDDGIPMLQEVELVIARRPES